MLSYIDIEAFATANQTVAKTSSEPSPFDAPVSTTSTVVASQKRKQIAKRMIASSRSSKLKLATEAA